MSDSQKIRIDIAGRLYPLTIKAKDEEMMRKVGKRINELISKIESTYAVTDKSDALAMCALQLGVQLELKNDNSSQLENNDTQQWLELEEEIDRALSKFT